MVQEVSEFRREIYVFGAQPYGCMAVSVASLLTQASRVLRLWLDDPDFWPNGPEALKPKSSPNLIGQAAKKALKPK